MTVYTKNPEEVFAPTDGSGKPRGADMSEARTLTVEMAAAIEEAIVIAESAASGFVRNETGVDAATTAALPACTYANGTSGVGATLTGNANGALPSQDGVSITVGLRLLVKNQAAKLQHGPYTVTQVGDGSNPFILTRVTDGDSAAELAESGWVVLSGTVNGGATYALELEAASITIGTTELIFRLAGAPNDALTSHLADVANPHSVSKSQVGLGNVDNTSDVDKPISTATQAALDGKQPLDSDLTTLAGLSKADGNFIVGDGAAWTAESGSTARTSIGLGNVDNTSDANKPVSTATQTALDLKAPLASPALTGTPTVPTAALGTNTTQAASTAFVKAAIDVVLGGVSAAFDTLSEIATAIGLKADKTTSISGGGLVTGGGDFSANRTVTVTAATEDLVFERVSATVAVTPASLDAQYISEETRLMALHADDYLDSGDQGFAECDVEGNSAVDLAPFDFPERIAIANNGQSLANGDLSEPPLSDAQDYDILSYDSGASSAKPGFSSSTNNWSGGTADLIETTVRWNGAADCGETPLTAACKGFAERVWRASGTMPPMFGHAPAVGGVAIASLAHGGTWWWLWRDQIVEAARIAEEDLEETIAELAMFFIHGPANVNAGTAGATYKAALINDLVLYNNSVCRWLLNQRSPLFTMLVQSAYKVVTNAGVIAQAQWDACEECAILDYVTNDFHLPHVGDGIHLTNLGSDIMAAYLDRALYQRLYLGRAPDKITPMRPYFKDGFYYWPATIPNRAHPLVFTADWTTTQRGFAVIDGGGNVPLSSVTIDDDGSETGIAVIKAASDNSPSNPSGAWTMRAQRDFLAPSGLSVESEAASVDAHDSSPDVLHQSGADHPLYHYWPSVEMTGQTFSDSLS